MRCARTALLLAPALLAGCAGDPARHTLAELHGREPDVTEVQVQNSLDQAMVGYRKFLEKAPESARTPEAMRRLADLKLEKEYGIVGEREGAAPPAAPASAAESDEEFERRAAGARALPTTGDGSALELPGGKAAAPAGPLQAIALYDEILATYPAYAFNDQVLYQKARAYDELGRVDDAIAVIDRLIAEYPRSRHIDEVQFRRAEYFFTRRKYREAEKSYAAVTNIGVGSEYYELALYKLGWTFYKQDLHEEALREYLALLDYKVSTGYDFDHARDEEEDRRIADTYRVISLSFSTLGGPDVVGRYFTDNSHRSYEDRIYNHLAEYYFEKLRYNDAAATYGAFVERNPLHRASPRFSMRIVEIYEAGGFPKLVLESKKAFAATYGLQSEYWRHFDVKESPEVLSYLKTNLEDLARHYHALYQEADRADEKPANFDEAARWYRAYLASFPDDATTPAVHYRLADLLLEHRDFAEAAREYEHTAYDYPEHEQAAAAGYAAIYAHREHQKAAVDAEREVARRKAVDSTLRFVERFPQHEHAAAALGAAVDDLYDMKQFTAAISTARKLIDAYPEAEVAIRRSAWTVVADSSLETGDYSEAEQAYARQLELLPADDESRQGVVDNLAAAIYKQGEQANQAGDYRAAADHFLRVARAAPNSKIRPLAEYDAGAALIRLEDWGGAAAVLESFRQAYPNHALQQDATKQMAFVYRQEGNASRAAEEYDRIAAEAEDPEVRREAFLVAGELYEKARLVDRALSAYLGYVSQFPEPIEAAVETRFKISDLLRDKGDQAGYRDQLAQIVKIEAAAGDARTARVRYLGAQSALVFAEDAYRRFDEVELVEPFERNLKEKRQRMDVALREFGALVDYEVAEVTAAATFYMAELYGEFSQALLASQRPANLDPARLEEYETALKQEAAPFEQRAIKIHEKNLELLATGIDNAWVDKSIARLAALAPERYAKSEASSGLIASLDRYAYRAPTAAQVPAAAAADESEGAPATDGAKGMGDAPAH